MNVIYLLIIILGVAGQGIIKKPYTEKVGGNGIWFFGLLTSATALIFFAVTSKDPSWEWGLVPYAVLFAFSYAMSTVFFIKAIACGSLALSSLISSYALMLPTFYGLVFLKDSVSIGLFPGLILLVISCILINKKDENSKISLKWLIYILIATVTNGMCSVSQKMQQVAYNGAYKNEFMILALGIVVVFLGIMMWIKERGEIRTYAKYGWHLALICGIMNGIVNLLVMVLSGSMPASVMFPLISAGGIIITYIVSKWFYKEQLTKAQFWGFVLGIGSVVFLNI